MHRMIPLLPLACLAASPAAALDLPAHKPGLWEMAVAQGRGAPAFALQRCTDASTDEFINAVVGGLAGEACAKQEQKTVGDKIVMDSTCKVGSVTATTRAEITGSFDNAYTLTVSTHQGPANARRDEKRIAIDAKWLGPCAAGQKPGDILLPGGVKMNVRNIRGLLGLLGGMQ